MNAGGGIEEHLAVILGALALGGQAFNYILHLRVHGAILESERRMYDRIAREFVRREVCELRRATCIEGGSGIDEEQEL